jgi:hypothetical protein
MQGLIFLISKIFWLFYCAINVKKIYLSPVNLKITNELCENTYMPSKTSVKFFE